MAELVVQSVNEAGANPTMVSASAGGDQFTNDGMTMFRVKNGGGSPVTVTLVTQSFSNHGTKVNQTVTIPATTGDMLIGFLNPSKYNDANGKVQVTYSAVTSVTVVPFTVAKY